VLDLRVGGQTSCCLHLDLGQELGTRSTTSGQLGVAVAPLLTKQRPIVTRSSRLDAEEMAPCAECGISLAALQRARPSYEANT
jgi:hypothetical protein